MKRELSIEDCYIGNVFSFDNHYYCSVDDSIWVWQTDRAPFNYLVNIHNFDKPLKKFKDLLSALNYALELEKKYIKYNAAARIKGMMRLTVMITKLKERRKAKCQ